jgi:hypothetical protein
VKTVGAAFLAAKEPTSYTELAAFVEDVARVELF